MNDTPKAIPTEYAGVQFKSRLEAQAAYLFDQFGWNWKYEPASYMLDNGISYTPDFFIDDIGAFWECRGYASEKGGLQIAGFAATIASGSLTNPVDPGNSDPYAFVVLRGDAQSSIYQRKSCGCMVAVTFCKCCGWLIPPLADYVYTESGYSALGLYCISCAAPMESHRSHGWDGRSSVDRVAIITASEGTILVNGLTLHDSSSFFASARMDL